MESVRLSGFCINFICVIVLNVDVVLFAFNLYLLIEYGVAIAQWTQLCLPSCGLGSNLKHTRYAFSEFI